MYRAWRERYSSVGEFASKMAESLEESYGEVRRNLGDAHRRQKAVYDRTAEEGRYRVGQDVVLYKPQGLKGQSRKLKAVYDRPYKVVKVLSDLTYLVRKRGQAKMKTQHFNNLIPVPPESELRLERERRRVGDGSEIEEVLDESSAELEFEVDVG